MLTLAISFPGVSNAMVVHFLYLLPSSFQSSKGAEELRLHQAYFMLGRCGRRACVRRD